MAVPSIQGNFSGGELTPELWGHVDLARYNASAATARNLFVNYRGGLFSRAGTALVGRCKQTPPAAPPRDIPFQFSLSQSYALEFGDNYMRIKTSGFYVTEPSISITGATQANPCEITAAHNYADGDWVFIQSIVSMTELNGNTYIVANSDVPGGTFTLQDLDGTPINSTGYGAYTSGGLVSRIFTLATPYAAVDLPYLKFTQSADVMSLTLVNLLTNTEYPPYELSRFGVTNWTLVPLDLGADMVPPSVVGAVASNNPDAGASPATEPCAYAYSITAIDLSTGTESVASPRADVTDSIDMGVTAGSITVTWNAVPGAGKYNIYRTAPAYNTDSGSTTNALPVPAGALFFYAGSAYGNQFVDTNIVTDAAKTPPLHLDPFARGQVQGVAVTSSSSDWTVATVSISSGTGSGWTGEVVIVNQTIVAVITINPGKGYTPADTAVFVGDGTVVTADLTLGAQAGTYPAVVAYFQQRRIYAQSLNQPDTFWASQTGLYTNFDSGDPPNPRDSITASPFSQMVSGIQWLIPMPGGLVALTGSGAWQITGEGGSSLNPQPITPSSEQAQPQAFNGCHDHVPPIRVNYDILYVEARGNWVRNLNYNIYFNIYYTADVCWPSAHFFNGHQIEQWAWTEEPYKIIWSVREDGILLSLTYIKEQEVMGWARHDTQGLFRGVCSVTEPAPQNKLYLSPTDALYLIVERYVQGRWLYFSERMNDRIWITAEDCWCVDCGLSTLTADAFPTATLSASAASGAGVIFTCDVGVFPATAVGSVLRLGGGIATVTGYLSPTQVIGTWTRPMVNTLPGDPSNTPIPAAELTWSLLPLISVIGGLSHLAGKQVVVLADGVPVGPLVVSAGGTVTLPYAASLIVIGLAFLPQFQSLYLEAGQPTIQGRRKTLTAVTARVAASGWPKAAANENDGSALDPPQAAPVWTGMQQLQPSPPGTAPPTYLSTGGQTVTPLYTGDLRVLLRGDWKKQGQVAIQQEQPLALNLLAIVPEYLEGDAPEVTYRPGSRSNRRNEAQA